MWRKWAWRAAVVVIALAVPGVVSAVNTIGAFGDLYRARPDATQVQPAAKEHDPKKPTVAFVTAVAGTNAADLLGPYEVLAGSGEVNAYVVSAGARVVPMTGGLDIVPDLTFAELDKLLRERDDSLDAVVIPALQDQEPAESAAISRWLRAQAADGALPVSVCRGARALAETGLLDGHTATSHWLRLPGLREDFPKVKWVDGVRYVDDGEVVSTAGVTSGVEGGLRILERLVGDDAAQQAAERVHWRHYSPGKPSSIPPAAFELPDIVVGLNSSYQTGPRAAGVLLQDGVGELELGSVFNTYTEQSMVSRTIAVGDGPIQTEHGLTFVPRSNLADAEDDIDRLLVPGLDAARSKSAPDVGGLQPEYLHARAEFAFDPVLRDIARTYDVQSARFAAKTLEYRASEVKLSGDSWPWLPTLVPLVLALLGAAVAVATGAAFRRRRARSPG